VKHPKFPSDPLGGSDVHADYRGEGLLALCHDHARITGQPPHNSGGRVVPTTLTNFGVQLPCMNSIWWMLTVYTHKITLLHTIKEIFNVVLVVAAVVAPLLVGYQERVAEQVLYSDVKWPEPDQQLLAAQAWAPELANGANALRALTAVGCFYMLLAVHIVSAVHLPVDLLPNVGARLNDFELVANNVVTNALFQKLGPGRWKLPAIAILRCETLLHGLEKLQQMVGVYFPFQLDCQKQLAQFCNL
jgi:hypothetical protein